ncbi:metallophosphoesterase [Streptomyces ochraceiscleroticus]|uniref:Metallophosphoesterase n=1 Tax=Streptomyces ochraceiscleroticus TaxID=47761 RepID=A0ABW1MFX9_9ACTN|nr:metallophosphoesterase [Streptomyces ochraceiscleroticus]
MIFLLVVAAIFALLGAVHGYLWRRLVRDTTSPGSGARRTGTVLAVVLPLLTVGALVAPRAGAPFRLQQLFAWPGYLWLALVLYLTLALLAGEVVRVVWLRAVRVRETVPEPVREQIREPEPVPAGADAGGDAGADAGAGGDTAVASAPPAPAPAAPSRRLFVARSVAVGASAAAAATVGYGTYSVLSGPRLKRVTVPLAKLPRAAHGFRVAVVSDIHLGPVLGRAHTRRIVDTVNRANPDLIAIVGDLVDGSVADLGPAAEPLRALTARHGAYFVTGNHEYFSGAQQWVDQVRELGVHPLENARVELSGFDLAGVNDISGENYADGPDYDRALGDRDPARASVLLAHQPVMIHEAVRHGVDLQLSGHTHGGQLWPGNLVAAAANPTVAGLDRYGDTQLYVSRGAGAWGPPVRVGAPPDVTIVQLASRQA